MKVSLHRYDLPVRHPFTIARGTTTVQRTLLVELEQQGQHGYGEAPECQYYGATIESMTAALEEARAALAAAVLDEPAAFWDQMRPVLAKSSFAQCAVDAAAHYKIKLGTPHDVEIVRALREHTNAVFRVDANCAWGVAETLRNAAALKPLGVELIEQPLPPGEHEAMQEV
jgi:L-alanine-DL-glutamate epimerase-like enolase superfamily enzyme